MKKFFIVLCGLTLAGLSLRAQSLTVEDRNRGIEYLEKTRAAIVEATQGLSAEQWNFKPAPDRWSVAEVTEHIAASEDFLMALVKDTVMKMTANPEATDLKAVEEFVIKTITDRSSKVKAPEPLIPSNRFRTPAESLQHFKDSRAKTIVFMKETKDLREHAMDTPIGKKLDAFQWMIFVAAHSERHTKQLLEVKATPGFPKN